MKEIISVEERSLPVEILIEILKNLEKPADMVRASLVNKTWNNIITEFSYLLSNRIREHIYHALDRMNIPMTINMHKSLQNSNYRYLQKIAQQVMQEQKYVESGMVAERAKIVQKVLHPSSLLLLVQQSFAEAFFHIAKPYYLLRQCTSAKKAMSIFALAFLLASALILSLLGHEVNLNLPIQIGYGVGKSVLRNSTIYFTLFFLFKLGSAIYYSRSQCFDRVANELVNGFPEYDVESNLLLEESAVEEIRMSESITIPNTISWYSHRDNSNITFFSMTEISPPDFATIKADEKECIDEKKYK